MPANNAVAINSSKLTPTSPSLREFSIPSLSCLSRPLPAIRLKNILISKAANGIKRALTINNGVDNAINPKNANNPTPTSHNNATFFNAFVVSFVEYCLDNKFRNILISKTAIGIATKPIIIAGVDNAIIPVKTNKASPTSPNNCAFFNAFFVSFVFSRADVISVIASARFLETDLGTNANISNPCEKLLTLTPNAPNNATPSFTEELFSALDLILSIAFSAVFLFIRAANWVEIVSNCVVITSKYDIALDIPVTTSNISFVVLLVSSNVFSIFDIGDIKSFTEKAAILLS